MFRTRVASAFSAIYWALVVVNLVLNRDPFVQAISGGIVQTSFTTPQGELVYVTFFTLVVSVIALVSLKRFFSLLALAPYFVYLKFLPLPLSFVGFSAFLIAGLYTRRVVIPLSVLTAVLGVYLAWDSPAIGLQSTTGSLVLPAALYFAYSAVVSAVPGRGVSLKSYEVRCNGETATVKLFVNGKVDGVEVGGVKAVNRGDHYEVSLKAPASAEVYYVRGKKRAKLGVVKVPEPLRVVINQVGDSLNFQTFMGSQQVDPDFIEVAVDGKRASYRRISKGVYRIEAKGSYYEVKATKGDCSGSATFTVVHQQAQVQANTLVGRTVYGYTIVKQLGEGGFSQVFLAEKGGKKFAVKVPKLDYLRSSPDANARVTEVLSEVMGLSSFLGKNPYIVSLEGVYVDRQDMSEILRGNLKVYYERPPAIVMELEEGGTLHDLMDRDDVFFSDHWQRIVFFVAWKVAEALSAIHKTGFVHSDVKPQNIFLSSKPPKLPKEIYDSLVQGRTIPKLGDLGNAVKINGSPVGFTAEYAPLEQVIAICKRDVQEGMKPVDDVYSLGATVFTLLTRSFLNSKEMMGAMNGVTNCSDVEVLRQRRLQLYATRDYIPLLNALRNGPYSARAQEIVDFVKRMTAPERAQRPTAEEAAKFFSSLA